MSEIVSIEGGNVRVGGDDGTIVSLPIAAIRYANPRVGDHVRVYRDDHETVVTRLGAAPGRVGSDGDRRRVSKVPYVLMSFFLGGLGIHRLLRGQVGLGVLMLLLGSWGTLFIRPLVDFIVGLTKLSAYPGVDFVFTADGRWAR